METTRHIIHFTLPGLLPEQDGLALNYRLATLTYLSYRNERPMILEEQQLNPEELRLVELILRAFPRYCPTEILLAVYENRTDEFSIQSYRRRLKQVVRDGSYLLYIQPLKVQIASIRKKLQQLDLDLYCLLETGYLLRKRTTPVRPLQETPSH